MGSIDKVFRINAIGAFIQGRKLLGRIPGLRIKIWQAFGLNLVVFFVLFIGGFLAGFHFLLEPMEESLREWLPGWLDWSATTLEYGLMLILLLMSLFLAVLLPLNLMFIWYENLVEKVMEFRGAPRVEPAIKTPLLVTIRQTLREVIIIFGLFFLGFFPLIGPPLVFVFSSHMMGRATFEPYISVMRNRGIEVEIPERRFGLTSISIGALEAGLPFYIPVIGLFLIPWCVLHLVIGLAWLYESERMSRDGGSLPAPG